MMLAVNLELTAWCPVHVVPLKGEPRLCLEPDRGSFFLVLSSMSCPTAGSQTDCISKWLVHLVPDEITPEAARARSKVG